MPKKIIKADIVIEGDYVVELKNPVVFHSTIDKAKSKRKNKKDKYEHSFAFIPTDEIKKDKFIFIGCGGLMINEIKK